MKNLSKIQLRIFSEDFSAKKLRVRPRSQSCFLARIFGGKNCECDREAYLHTSEGAVDCFSPKNTDKTTYVRGSSQLCFSPKNTDKKNTVKNKKRGAPIESAPLVMLLLEARQTNRSRVLVVSVLTRGDYINAVQLSYFACRTFIFHITSPYTNKSITDCIIIIYDILLFVNTFLKILYFF